MLNRPSAVTLVASATSSTHTYEWVANNVKSMNRTNKLSSLPFFVEDGKNRKHQFRLVLLRGVVKGATEDKDPLAVYLEYMPDPNIVGVDIYPGNCKVAVWCVDRHASEKEEVEFEKKKKSDSQPSSGEVAFSVLSTKSSSFCLMRGPPHRYEETTYSFSGNEKMVGFKEILPGEDLANEAIVDPNAFNALTVRLEITLGVETVVDVVAKATDRWASSFWGSATSAFSVLQTGLDVIKSQVLNTIEERFESGDAFVASTESHRAAPWDELPMPWAKAGRSIEEWRKLITETIVEDEGTFLFGADRGLHPDEQILMTQLGLNHRAIMTAAALFDFERDVHEGLLGPAAIRKQRYNLVPKVIKDTVFWCNYMWKVSALSTAPRDDQIHLLLSIVNAPPRVAKAARNAPSASMSMPQEVRSGDDAGDARDSREDSALIQRYERDVAEATKAALEATEVLQELIADDAEAVFITSAVQSCSTSRQKLEETKARVATFKGSSLAHLVSALDAASASLDESVAKAHEVLALCTDASPSKSVPAAEPVAEPVTEPVTEPVAEPASVPQIASPAGDFASPKPNPPPTAAASAKSIASLNFLDDEFSELSASPARFVSATAKPSPSVQKETSVSTSKKIEFEPMPWDDDEY